MDLYGKDPKPVMLLVVGVLVYLFNKEQSVQSALDIAALFIKEIEKRK